MEHDRYNFALLNMPEDTLAGRPDAFLVANVGGRSQNGDPEVVLRTHTPRYRSGRCSRSPADPDHRPGRAYRNEATDASHKWQFSQVEGLCVDEPTTMGDLRGCLTVMNSALYGEGDQVRFHSGYCPSWSRGGVRHVLQHLRDKGSAPARGRGGWRRGLRDGAPRGAGELRARSAALQRWAFGFGFDG